MPLTKAIKGLARLEGELDTASEAILQMLIDLGWHKVSVTLQDILARRKAKPWRPAVKS